MYYIAIKVRHLIKYVYKGQHFHLIFLSHYYVSGCPIHLRRVGMEQWLDCLTCTCWIRCEF